MTSQTGAEDQGLCIQPPAEFYPSEFRSIKNVATGEETTEKPAALVVPVSSPLKEPLGETGSQELRDQRSYPETDLETSNFSRDPSEEDMSEWGTSGGWSWVTTRITETQHRPLTVRKKVLEDEGHCPYRQMILI